MMPNPFRTPTDAADAIQLAHEAAVKAAADRRLVAAAEFQRPLAKDQAIRAIIAENENAGRSVSYTGAERVVENHPVYVTACQTVRELQFEADVAEAQAEAYGRFADLLIAQEYRDADH